MTSGGIKIIMFDLLTEFVGIVRETDGCVIFEARVGALAEVTAGV